MWYFQAFKELHEKLKFASQKIKLIDMQIDNLRRTKQHNALTKQEIVVGIIIIKFVCTYTYNCWFTIKNCITNVGQWPCSWNH